MTYQSGQRVIVTPYAGKARRALVVQHRGELTTVRYGDGSRAVVSSARVTPNTTTRGTLDTASH